MEEGERKNLTAWRWKRSLMPRGASPMGRAPRFVGKKGFPVFTSFRWCSETHWRLASWRASTSFMASACLGFLSATATHVWRRWSATFLGLQKKRFSWCSCLQWAAFAWCSTWLSSTTWAGARSRLPSGVSRPAGSLSVRSGRRTWRICPSHPTWDAHSPVNQPMSDNEEKKNGRRGMEVQERAWINYDFNLMKTVRRSNKMTSSLWWCNETECKKTKPLALPLLSRKSRGRRKCHSIKEDKKFSFTSEHDERILVSWGDIPTAILYFWVFY